MFKLLKPKSVKRTYSTYDLAMRKNIIQFIKALYEHKKEKKYQEDLSLVDHCLQVAHFAEKKNSTPQFFFYFLLTKIHHCLFVA
jgi:predicted HD phosphohydrolase